MFLKNRLSHHCGWLSHHIINIPMIFPRLVAITPHVICYIAIEHDPVEIGSCPIEHDDFPWIFVCLPEGTPHIVDLCCCLCRPAKSSADKHEMKVMGEQLVEGGAENWYPLVN